MLNFHIKFVQTDRRTDRWTNTLMDRRTMVKQYAPDLLMWGHKNVTFSNFPKTNINFSVTFILSSANALNLERSEIFLFGNEFKI